jgi:uncharacterized membrane protein
VNQRRVPSLLLIIILLYTLIFTYLSLLRYENFFTSAWDLGIFQQALWSTLHGKLFYEAGDYCTYNAGSFLIVHPAFIMFLLALLYWVYPHALTLFVIQALAVSSAAVPLYKLAERLGSSRSVALTGIMVYLLNAFLLGSYLYDFHLEAFLPLESFSFFYLIMTRRYRLAALAFIFGVFTLEIFPFIALSIILYFAYDRFGIGMLAFWRRFKDRTYRTYLYIAVAAVLSYIVLRIIENYIVPSLIGSPITGSVARHGLNLSFFIPSVVNSQRVLNGLVYWLLLYASFGFLSLKHPKSIIIASPLMYFSIILYPEYTRYFGFQYSLIFIIPVALGFIIGLSSMNEGKLIDIIDVMLIMSIATILLYYFTIYPHATAFIYGTISAEERFSLLIAPTLLAAATLISKGILSSSVEAKLGQTSLASLIIIALIVLLAANVSLSPLNIANVSTGYGSGYAFSYTANPAYKYMSKVVDLIPNNATVLTPDLLFPYVANRLNSYPYYSAPMPYLSFNSSNLPDYILTDGYSFPYMPQDLQSVLVNGSQYGTRALVTVSSYPDNIFLLQRGYEGPPVVYEATPLVYDYRNLGLGQGSELIRSNSSPSYYIYEPANASGYTTTWFGPYTLLPPGTYKVTYLIMASSNYSGYLLTLDVTTNYGAKIIASEPLYGYELNGPMRWTNVSMEFTLSGVTPLLEFRGVQSSGVVGLYLANVTVEPLQVPRNISTIFPWQLEHSSQMQICGDGSLRGYNMSSQTAWYGPYINMQPGVYFVRYNLDSWGGAAHDEKMLIEVTADYGKITLFTSPLCWACADNWSGFYLILNQSYSAVEFKAYVYEWPGELALDNITVERLPASALPLSIHEVYPPCLLVITNASYIRNGMLYSRAPRAGMLWYGPYTTLYPGLYKVTFWINGNATPSSELVLQVTSNFGSTVLVRHAVYGSGIHGWTPVTLQLRVNSTQQYVEFRGYVVNWDGAIELSKVEVEGVIG